MCRAVESLARFTVLLDVVVVVVVVVDVEVEVDRVVVDVEVNRVAIALIRVICVLYTLSGNQNRIVIQSNCNCVTFAHNQTEVDSSFVVVRTHIFVESKANQQLPTKS